MAEDGPGLHEARGDMSEETIDRHRAIRSLMEELEAIDWYDQRVDATHDPTLKAVLAHNRDEEKEHAVMTLEWLRRRDPVLDGYLREYLFTDVELGGHHDHDHDHDHGEPPRDGGGSLGVGSLRARPAGEDA